MKKRCEWAGNDPLYVAYHDEQWGVPVHDDRFLFEMLILEGAQAGLSWLTILKKRETYRAAFDAFDPAKVARYGPRDVKRLLANSGIVRNRLKIEATIRNARACLEIQDKFGSLDQYLWRFVGGSPLQNNRRSLSGIPPRTKESDLMSEDLKQAGCNFVGSTICYAFMQAVGMVNDHTVNCFRRREIRKMSRDA